MARITGLALSKFKIPNPKKIPKPKFPNRLDAAIIGIWVLGFCLLAIYRSWGLGFGISLVFGFWCLAFTSSLSLARLRASPQSPPHHKRTHPRSHPQPIVMPPKGACPPAKRHSAQGLFASCGALESRSLPPVWRRARLLRQD